MLYIVATPIGNMEDITLRAITALGNSDLILAEDTRVTKNLLERYNIKKEIISYHQHSDQKKIGLIISHLERGKTLSLVSDAGTPGINDPGGFLIQEILKEMPDLKIVPIPGANAAIAALSISGFPSDKFTYLGFPPHKKGRQMFFKNLESIKHTIVFYESKHRIKKALEALTKSDGLSKRNLVVGREITKQFETIYRGRAEEIISKIHESQILGEFIIVVGPTPKNNAEEK